MTFDFAAAIADIPDATIDPYWHVRVDGSAVCAGGREFAEEIYAKKKLRGGVVELFCDGRVVLSCRPKGASHV